jgi:hypothetical protein
MQRLDLLIVLLLSQVPFTLWVNHPAMQIASSHSF